MQVCIQIYFSIKCLALVLPKKNDVAKHKNTGLEIFPLAFKYTRQHLHDLPIEEGTYIS